MTDANKSATFAVSSSCEFELVRGICLVNLNRRDAVVELVSNRIKGYVHFPKPVSQSVSNFTVPPRAHPSTGSQSGSATPGLTQVPSTRSPGGYSIVASEVNLSQRTGCSLPLFALCC